MSTNDTKYTVVIAATDVTSEIREIAESVFDGWYADEPRIDWEDFLDRMDRDRRLEDGTTLDLGSNLDSPAAREIKKHIRAYRKEQT